MSYGIHKQLGLEEQKSTTMRLLMLDRSINHLVWIPYDILVKVDWFIFPTDLEILDWDFNEEIPIIFGRPFLVTEGALVDVENYKLMFQINDDELIFSIFKAMK